MASGRTQTVYFESESDSDLKNQVPTKKRKTLNYVVAETFADFSKAKKHVKDLKDWIYRNKYRTENSEIHQYACCQSFNCSSRYRIILPFTSQEAVVEKTNLDHDHLEKPSRGTVSYTHLT